MEVKAVFTRVALLQDIIVVTLSTMELSVKSLIPRGTVWDCSLFLLDSLQLRIVGILSNGRLYGRAFLRKTCVVRENIVMVGQVLNIVACYLAR